MGVSNKEGVAQVHLKGVAMAAKTILNEQREELGMVQEIHSHDPERVCPPMCYIEVFWGDVVHCDSN